MAPSGTIAATALLAFAVAASASPAKHCPTFQNGVSTTELPAPTDLTTTIYAGTIGDGVFLNCHGYTSLFVQTSPGVTPTETISHRGTITTASYLCSPTTLPQSCCPTPHPGLTTTCLPKPTDKTTTIYKGTIGDGVFIDCHGYSTVTVETPQGVKPTSTITVPGTITTAEYLCSPTTTPPECSKKY